jgi:hypothetical protein
MGGELRKPSTVRSGVDCASRKLDWIATTTQAGRIALINRVLILHDAAVLTQPRDTNVFRWHLLANNVEDAAYGDHANVDSESGTAVFFHLNIYAVYATSPRSAPASEWEWTYTSIIELIYTTGNVDFGIRPLCTALWCACEGSRRVGLNFHGRWIDQGCVFASFRNRQAGGEDKPRRAPPARMPCRARETR